MGRGTKEGKLSTDRERTRQQRGWGQAETTEREDHERGEAEREEEGS